MIYIYTYIYGTPSWYHRPANPPKYRKQRATRALADARALDIEGSGCLGCLFLVNNV